MAKNEERSANVGTVLRDVLKRIDPDKRLHAFEAWNFWNDIVGETLARRAQPSGYRNGVLFVTVAAHAWMQELQFMKDALRERLNVRLGSELIRDIYFVSGAVEAPEERPTAVEPVEEPQSALPPLPVLSDPQLAATFQRLIEAQARRKRKPKAPRNG
jgi:predicted nucleic acid-binding Zn ribbon protein